MQNCQLKMHISDSIVSVSLLFIHRIKIAIPYFALPERKPLNVKKKEDSPLSGMALQTRYYLQYNQGSYGSIGMYLCKPQVHIVSNPQ
jgi:hypothetical protein